VSDRARGQRPRRGSREVNLHLLTPDGTQAVLDPTTVMIGRVTVLSHALGLGYDREKIQVADLALTHGNQLVACVDANLPAIRRIPGSEPAYDVLYRVIEKMTFDRSAIVAVICA